MLKHLLLLFVIVLLPFIPVFGLEPKNSTNSTIHTAITDQTNIANHIETNLSIPAIIEWHVGIFAIIGGAITLIGILLTVRFVFIDKAHGDLIKQFEIDRLKVLEEQEKLFDEGKFIKNDIRRFADQISSIDTALVDLRRYRQENSKAGTYIDTISMAILFVVGGLGTTGLFENEFNIFPIIVGSVVIFPISHFIIQLRHTKHSV